MTDYVKHLPTAGIPESGVAAWDAGDAERWLRARVHAAFAPVAGSWILSLLVILAVGLTAWHGPGPDGDWWAYAVSVLLVALPAWYRYLPVAVLPAAPVLAADAVLVLSDTPDTQGRIGCGLVLVLAAWAFAGALARLRARRRQRELSLAAVGSARFPLPTPLPAAHRRRGLPGIAFGSACCLAAAAALADGALLELRTAGSVEPYHPVDMQLLALVFLIPGTTALGLGLARRRAARRLRTRPQPALLVGVRASASERHWLYPDADTRTAAPLISHRARASDTLAGRRVLLSGSERTLRATHPDVDPCREPFEAVLYGAVYEGAEVVLESAVYEGNTRLVSSVTAVPLLPRRRHGLRSWTPSAGSYHEAVREQTRLAEERRRERERERKESKRSDTSAGGCGGGCGGCG